MAKVNNAVHAYSKILRTVSNHAHSLDVEADLREFSNNMIMAVAIYSEEVQVIAREEVAANMAIVRAVLPDVPEGIPSPHTPTGESGAGAGAGDGSSTEGSTS